ncbi:hypothetical protein [Aliamphritea spongicola]|uniref:hypothetical protein n=1 Tax=Aliamphritea spongicola TaxID=707589 RepID=UPI00196ACC7C|nr:hypothetical protein [Aliamphritea spongicola]MBN3560552.1 hypothetical protein [Aliamphritea spongicola]
MSNSIRNSIMRNATVLSITISLFLFLLNDLVFSDKVFYKAWINSGLNDPQFELLMGYSKVLFFIFTFLSIILLFLNYLQSGNPAKVATALFSKSKTNTSSKDYDTSSLKIKIENLNSEIIKLKNTSNITPQEKEDILSRIVDNATIDAIKNIFTNESKAFKDELTKNTEQEKLRSSILGIKNRIYREISDLRLRSNINLMIGMSITAGGLYLLWDTVDIIDTSTLLKELASENNESNNKFLRNLFLPLLPRILLVIFLEIFAYFFLRLYKDGLSEIKYFQNELTNLESKLIALETSYLTKNLASINKSVESLLKTERNFVLEKGQTTVELERAKSNTETTNTIINSVTSLLKTKSKE